ncbi:hypothetical protein PM082_000317 [Marasmius tenuissimus]|nr:hypothetical protein PM082_000317 [Marasmius tenuissimus]
MALSGEAFHKMYRVAPLVEKYAFAIKQVGLLSTVMAQMPRHAKAWCNEVFLDAAHETSIPSTEIHPPFEKAIILPARHSKQARQLDELCTGNREAYFALFLQFYVLFSQEDSFLRDTVSRLDPLQDFLYLCPDTDGTTFLDILDKQTCRYAQSIAEIGVLSVSMALIPGAPRAWVDAVFNALPILTPCEAVPVKMFFYNPADAI